jgi:hypothetical protein
LCGVRTHDTCVMGSNTTQGITLVSWVLTPHKHRINTEIYALCEVRTHDTSVMTSHVSDLGATVIGLTNVNVIKTEGDMTCAVRGAVSYSHVTPRHKWKDNI